MAVSAHGVNAMFKASVSCFNIIQDITISIESFSKAVVERSHLMMSLRESTRLLQGFCSLFMDGARSASKLSHCMPVAE